MPPRFLSADTSEVGTFPACCSPQPRGDETQLKNCSGPWLGQLEQHIEDTFGLHFSRHELILQKCLAILERQDTTKLEDKLDLKAEEWASQRAESAHPKLPEAKALSTDGIFVDMRGLGRDEIQQEFSTNAILEKLCGIEGILNSEAHELSSWMKSADSALATLSTAQAYPSEEAAAEEQRCTQRTGLRKSLESGFISESFNQTGGQTRSVWNAKIQAEEQGSWKQVLLRICFEWLVWWEELVEPERTGCLVRITDSSWFETLCAAVIMTNAVFTLICTNWEMENLGAEPTRLMFIGEFVFLGFYTAELLLRITAHRIFFFCGTELRWNLFDLFLVVFSLYDQLLVDLLYSSSEDGSGSGLTFMRTFRIFKMAKILRAVRAMQFVSELRLMLNSILGSFISLFWSFVMLLFIFYIFSLIFVQGCITHLLENENGVNSKDSTKIMKHFGSVQDAIMSLIQATTGGNDWDIFYQAVAPTGTTNAALFIFFIGFFQIALFNVLTGIFVENAMKLAQPDPYTLALEERKNEVIQAQELKYVCKDLEGEGGIISPEDFVRALDHGRVLRSHLRVLGLDIKDPKKFFSILTAATGTKEIHIDSFIAGCMKLKGPASSIDLQSLMSENKKLRRDLPGLLRGRGMSRQGSSFAQAAQDADAPLGQEQQDNTVRSGEVSYNGGIAHVDF